MSAVPEPVVRKPTRVANGVGRGDQLGFCCERRRRAAVPDGGGSLLASAADTGGAFSSLLSLAQPVITSPGTCTTRSTSPALLTHPWVDSDHLTGDTPLPRRF